MDWAKFDLFRKTNEIVTKAGIIDAGSDHGRVAMIYFFILKMIQETFEKACKNKQNFRWYLVRAAKSCFA